jgi:hypothetical protein
MTYVNNSYWIKRFLFCCAEGLAESFIEELKDPESYFTKWVRNQQTKFGRFSDTEIAMHWIFWITTNCR